jgi:hypothetical protein
MAGCVSDGQLVDPVRIGQDIKTPCGIVGMVNHVGIAAVEQALLIQGAALVITALHHGAVALALGAGDPTALVVLEPIVLGIGIHAVGHAPGNVIPVGGDRAGLVVTPDQAAGSVIAVLPGVIAVKRLQDRHFSQVSRYPA